MFDNRRQRMGSNRGRSGIRLELTELNRRDVPSATVASLGPILGLDAPAAGVAHTSGASTNGAAGQMPAFFDGKSVTVNMKELPDDASDATIGHSPSINTIYAYADLDEEQPFAPVIDAIQGDGFNPLWQQVLIKFNAGFTPRQFTSEQEVLAAASGPNPEITLVTTDEVYRCAVVGSKS